jgi:hypothetical protein
MSCSRVVLTACVALGTLVGCAQPALPVAPQPLLPAEIITQRAGLLAGCLLPPQALLETASSASIELQVEVPASGPPLRATVVKGTGVADVDAAFVKSALGCSFTPPRSRSNVTQQPASLSDRYTLRHTWSAGQYAFGPFRCFKPDYPAMSARLQEESVVKVYFRQAAAGEPYEFRIQAEPSFPRLNEASLEAVRRCLVHPEAQVGIQPGMWHMVPYRWELAN